MLRVFVTADWLIFAFATTARTLPLDESLMDAFQAPLLPTFVVLTVVQGPLPFLRTWISTLVPFLTETDLKRSFGF